MGSPTKSLRTQASRSRFHEGSMNDKVSAVPPVQFLGPEERDALERPVELDHLLHLQQSPFMQSQQRLHDPHHPLQKAHSHIHIHFQPSSLSLSHIQTHHLSSSSSSSGGPAPHPHPHPHPHQKHGHMGKKGSSNLFGQVWEGVRDKLKLRREPSIPADHLPIHGSSSSAFHNNHSNHHNKKKPPPPPTDAIKRPDLERPTREETLATYHQLMASGFFDQHAIQSTRHARPPSIRPSCPSRGSLAPSVSSYQQADFAAPPPLWSLPLPPPRPRTPRSDRPFSPYVTAASPSSRGTKRAADGESITIHLDEDSDDDDHHEKNHISRTSTNININTDTNTNYKNNSDSHSLYSISNKHSDSHSRRDRKHGGAGEADAHAHTDADDTESRASNRTSKTSKKVRKIAYKNFLPLPQLAGAKTKLLISKRVSSSTSMRSAFLPPVIVQKKEPAAKPSNRSHSPAPAASSSITTPARTSLELLSERMYSTVRRNVSENYYSVRAVGSGSMTSRALRPREGDSLSVMPDANRGIPRVPLIPSKYATSYADDGENRHVWRANCQVVS